MSKKINNKKKGSKVGNIITNIILVIAIIVFLGSAVKLVTLLIPYYQGEKDYDKVKELAVMVETDDDLGADEDEKGKFTVDFESLKEINPDTIGWIRFDEPSIISYPVVKSHDNKEYLTKTFSANDNKLGAIFMDKHNESDFSDRNTIIYGHNMRVGDQMFSQIRKYGNTEFRDENPYFYIYTPDNVEHKYRVFAAGVVREDADNYKMKFADDDEFARFLNLCKASNYDKSVELDMDSKIVTLSTCTCVNEYERFIVQGVLEED